MAVGIMLKIPLLTIETSSDFSDATSDVSTQNTQETTLDETTSNSSSSSDTSNKLYNLTRVKSLEKISESYNVDEFDAVVDITSDTPSNGTLKFSATSSFYGNKEFVKAVPDQGYHFSYLLKENKYISSDETTYFYTNLNNNFSSHFTQDGNYSVLFLNQDGSYLHQVETPENQKVEMYKYPTLEGYELKFEIDTSKLESVTEDLVILPQYIKQGYAGIDATNCSYAEKVYRYGDQITFLSEARGLLFQYFLVNGEIFSTNTSLTLTLYDDVVVEAVYGNTFNLNSPLVSLHQTAIEVDGKIYFDGFSAPVNNLIQVENGILLKDTIDAKYSESNVKVTRGISEIGEYKNGIVYSETIREKYIQSYAIYRETVNDEYVYVALVSDVYQIA